MQRVMLTSTLVIIVLAFGLVFFSTLTPFVRVETAGEEAGVLSDRKETMAQIINQRNLDGWILAREIQIPYYSSRFTTLVFEKRSPWYTDPSLPWNRR